MSSPAAYRPRAMSEIAERYERITDQFTDRVRAVSPGDWDNPSPCEGWTARDVVGHLTEWIPGFFEGQGVPFPAVPSVQDDPLAAWETVRSAMAGVLGDPALADKQISTPFSTQSLAETVDMIVTGDVFTHTWDLARATGQDETLDADQLQRMLASMGSIPDEVLRADGMFAPAVEVPDDADDQTRFLAIAGRRAAR
jgi:uncharacterized protein (TIGR03086 family)